MSAALQTLPRVEVWQAVRRKTQPLLVERVRLGLYLILISYVPFVAQDLMFSQDRLVWLLLIKVAQVSFVLASLWSLRSERFLRHAAAATLASITALGFLAVLSALVRQNTGSTVLLFIIITIGASMALPWGAWWQAALVGIFAVLLGWSQYSVHGSLLPVLADPANGAVLTAALLSLFTANGVQQFRYQIEERDLRLQRSQAELMHALRLGTLNEIASGLAHEINQPLGAIANYAAVVRRRLDSGAATPEELARGVDLIGSEAMRAGAILRRLRDLGRKGSIGMQVVDINTVIARAVELVRPQAELQGVTLVLATGSRLPAVYVDDIQIEQVALNLMLNGIEAMNASAPKILSVSAACEQHSVRITVRDTGGGYAIATGEQIFEPFFTTKAQGLGMGLAISRRIVEAHGGSLTGGPNPDGRGCTFSFVLPAAHQEASSTANPTEVLPPL